MRNWKQLASALGAGIPEAELDRVTGPLETLEAAFRPLTTKIPPETEPVYVVSLAEEKSE
jgi:hypothetical protein